MNSETSPFVESTVQTVETDDVPLAVMEAVGDLDAGEFDLSGELWVSQAFYYTDLDTGEKGDTPYYFVIDDNGVVGDFEGTGSSFGVLRSTSYDTRTHPAEEGMKKALEDGTPIALVTKDEMAFTATADGKTIPEDAGYDLSGYEYETMPIVRTYLYEKDKY